MDRVRSLVADPKSGGRPRTADLQDIADVILYITSSQDAHPQDRKIVLSRMIY
jgi:hypothetical protein